VRDLEIGSVVAVHARDQRVLARAGGGEEVDRLAAAHHPRLGLHRVVLEPAALEDPVVGLLVESEAPLEPLLVAVERVGVLHDELPDPDEARARPRLVAVLRLEVVPGLRQLPVALELARVEREGLLVGHREDEPAARAVLRVEDLRNLVAPGRLPELDRGQHRREPLLGADRVHLLADDLLDLPVDAPPEGRERPEARAELADEPAADEQLVTYCFRLGGRVAQRREMEL
jgi:hypothetical protein